MLSKCSQNAVKTLSKNPSFFSFSTFSGGDFNDNPLSPTYERITRKLKNPALKFISFDQYAHDEEYHTYGNLANWYTRKLKLKPDFMQVLDYILYKQPSTFMLEVKDFDVRNWGDCDAKAKKCYSLSDHSAIEAKFEIEPFDIY